MLMFFLQSAPEKSSYRRNIPGSMATPGFIARGKGLAESIDSASQGAGRTMSRTKAKQSILPGQ
jgi:RNA-splicing ligase RtcB